MTPGVRGLLLADSGLDSVLTGVTILPALLTAHRCKLSHVMLFDELPAPRQFIHQCLDLALCNLKQCSRNAQRMLDPNGNIRLVRTFLAAYIADLPEQQVISCVMTNYVHSRVIGVNIVNNLQKIMTTKPMNERVKGGPISCMRRICIFLQ